MGSICRAASAKWSLFWSSNFEFGDDLANSFVLLRRGEVMIPGAKETPAKHDVLAGEMV